jgi:hypothetical protein
MRASIERKRQIERLMSGPNECGEVIAQWNPQWIRCPVCLEMPDRDGVIIHKEPAEVRQ